MWKIQNFPILSQFLKIFPNFGKYLKFLLHMWIHNFHLAKSAPGWHFDIIYATFKFNRLSIWHLFATLMSYIMVKISIFNSILQWIWVFHFNWNLWNILYSRLNWFVSFRLFFNIYILLNWKNICSILNASFIMDFQFKCKKGSKYF